MSIGIIGLLIAVIFVLIVGFSTFKIVPQGEVYLIERLGQFHRELRGGLHIIIPFLDSVRRRIDLRTQVLDIPPQGVITKDSTSVQIDGVVYFKVTDAMNAEYEVQNLRVALTNITQTTLRNAIGEMDLDKTFSSREEINLRLRQSLDEATDKWGVKVERVEIKNIDPPHEIRQSMEKQMQAERTRRQQVLLAEADQKALVLRSEGEKQSQILLAEAKKQAQILDAEAEKEAQVRRAEGEAQAIRTVAEAKKDQYQLVYKGLLEAGLNEKILAYEQIQAFKELAKSPNKTIVPAEMSGLMGTVAALQSTTQTKLSDQTPPPEAV